MDVLEKVLSKHGLKFAFGNYGEQHLYGLEGNNYSYILSEQFKENYIMPYRNAFQNTLLVNACNGDLYTDVYEWAVNQGMALRRDGILGYSDGKEGSFIED